MKKLLISLLTLIPIFSATSILVSSQKVNDLSTRNFQQVQENIDLVPNSNDFSATNENNFYTLQGQNYNIVYRTYMSSKKNDTDLPDKDKDKNYQDFVIKGKKDIWYDYEVQGLSLDISSLRLSKDEFLKKYRAVTTSFLYMNNLWNGLHKWRYPGGKLSPYNIDPYTFSLTAGNYQDTVYIDSAKEHSNNEKTRLIINQTWNGNTLNIDWKLGLWYNWKANSIYNHAALAYFTNDKYTLIAVPDYNPDIQNVHIDRAEYFHDIDLKHENNKVNYLNLVDQELETKAITEELRNAWFKETTIFTAYFYWIEKNQGHCLTIQFLGDTALNFVSTLILFGGLIERNFTLDDSNNLLKAVYNDEFANKITTDSIAFIVKNKKNITYSSAKIVVPFIYID